MKKMNKLSLVNLGLATLGTAMIILVVGLMTVTPKEVKYVPTDIAREVVAPSVVPFRVLSMNNERFATGFHLKFFGKVYVMTNRHVCDSNIEKVNKEYAQFGDSIHKIIAIDTEHDLCLLESDRTDGLSLAAADTKDLEKVYLVGFPRGEPLTIREGRRMEESMLFAPWLDDRMVSYVQISTITYGGNSGSPVTNMAGDVVGVLFAGDRRYITEGYYVPHRYVLDFMVRTVLGISLIIK